MEALYIDLDAAKRVSPTKSAEDEHYLLNAAGEIISTTQNNSSLLGKSFFDACHVDDSEREALSRFLVFGTSSAMLAQSRETPFLILRSLFGMTGNYLVALPPKSLRAILSGPAWYTAGEQNGIALSPASRAAQASLDGSYRDAVSWLDAYRPLLLQEFKLFSENDLLTMAAATLAKQIVNLFGCTLVYAFPNSCPIYAKSLDAHFLRGALTALSFVSRRAGDDSEIRIAFGMEDTTPVLYADVTKASEDGERELKGVLKAANERGITARYSFESATSTVHFASALSKSEISEQGLRASHPIWG